MRTVKRWIVVAIVTLLAVSSLPFAAGAAPGDDRARPVGQPDFAGTSELIVRFRSDLPGESTPSRLHERDDSPAGRLSRQLEGSLTSRKPLRSAEDTQVFTFDSAESASEALETLKADPEVELVEPNLTRELHYVPDSNEHWEEQRWWVETVGLQDAWNITTGDPELIVAVIDSGVSPTHPDLEGKLVSGYNAIDGTDNFADIEGHGTRVASIIAAADGDIGIAGAAMDVKIMPIRVLEDDRATIKLTSIYDAIVWAVDNGADVINMSFGSDSASELERSAIQYAYENNIPMIASGGNRFNRVSYPANYPETIAVGSLDANGNRSRFSSIITTIDIAAPGEQLFSASWDSTRGDHWDDRLLNGRVVEGTSFSAAIVTGVVALQKSINPDMSVEQVRSVLTSNAVDSGEPGPESGVGAGQVDAEASVRSVAYWSMYDTWYPTDFPVATGSVVRTWLWGTDPPGNFAYEEYAESRHGMRLVYYYDKSRMELTHPLIDRGERWYVTNGLLVNELITGEMQVGDGEFITRSPAEVNVAGDPDDMLGPTYATFGSLLDVPPLDQGQVITETLARDGTTGSDERFADYNVWAEYLDETTNHRVADVFWDYLNSYGLVAYGDELVTDLLFEPWFYATGLPVTEAYWSEVTVAGQVRDVLVQCFERRCMTYTPDNDPGWRVEMGNVGLHYYAWRYESDPAPSPEPDPVEPPEPAVLYESNLQDWPEATFTGGATFTQPGAYHMLATTGEGFTVSEFAQIDPLEDFSAFVDIKVVQAGADGEGCLATRFDVLVGSGYLWCINGDGETVGYHHGMDSDGADSVEEIVAADVRSGTNPVAEWNTLGMTLHGDGLLFTINGSQAAVLEHDGSSSGEVGILVANRSDLPVEYAFRNLMVIAAPDELPSP